VSRSSLTMRSTSPLLPSRVTECASASPRPGKRLSTGGKSTNAARRNPAPPNRHARRRQPTNRGHPRPSGSWICRPLPSTVTAYNALCRVSQLHQALQTRALLSCWPPPSKRFSKIGDLIHRPDRSGPLSFFNGLFQPLEQHLFGIGDPSSTAFELTQ